MPAILPFLLKTLAFLAIQGAVCALLLGLHPGDSTSDDYMASIYDKVHAVRDTPGSRVILVGGSGVAFGFNSDVMTEVAGRPVLNFGLHANIPFEWYLSELEPNLRPGDTVVLVPELIRAGLTEEAALNSDCIRMLSLKPQSLFHLPARVWSEMNILATYRTLPGDGLLRFGCLVVQNVARDRLHFLTHKSVIPHGDGKDYDRSAFNARGDHAAHWTRAGKANYPIGRADVDDICRNIDMLNQWASKLEVKGVRCLFAFPAIAAPIAEANREQFAAIEQRFASERKIPILPPRQIIALKPEENYDTAYHLTGPAAEARSRALGAEIRKQLDAR